MRYGNILRQLSCILMTVNGEGIVRGARLQLLHLPHLLIIIHHRLLLVLLLPLDPLLNHVLIDSLRFCRNPPLALLQQMLSAQAITVQVALLYTNSSGERRIRVHTVLLPVVQVSYISVTCIVVQLLHHGTFGHRLIHSFFVCEFILSLTYLLPLSLTFFFHAPPFYSFYAYSLIFSILLSFRTISGSTHRFSVF